MSIARDRFFVVSLLSRASSILFDIYPFTAQMPGREDVSDVNEQTNLFFARAHTTAEPRLTDISRLVPLAVD